MAQQTTQNDDLRDKLVKYIEDMYTLETQIIETEDGSSGFPGEHVPARNRLKLLRAE